MRGLNPIPRFPLFAQIAPSSVGRRRVFFQTGSGDVLASSPVGSPLSLQNETRTASRWENGRGIAEKLGEEGQEGWNDPRTVWAMIGGEKGPSAGERDHSQVFWGRGDATACHFSQPLTRSRRLFACMPRNIGSSSDLLLDAARQSSSFVRCSMSDSRDGCVGGGIMP